LLSSEWKNLSARDVAEHFPQGFIFAFEHDKQHMVGELNVGC